MQCSNSSVLTALPLVISTGKTDLFPLGCVVCQMSALPVKNGFGAKLLLRDGRFMNTRVVYEFG